MPKRSRIQLLNKAWRGPAKTSHANTLLGLTPFIASTEIVTSAASRDTKGKVRLHNRTTRRVVAILIAASLGVTLFATPAQAATASPDTVTLNRCGFATLVAVRGTNEPAGSGSTNGDRTYQSGGFGAILSQLYTQYYPDPDIPIYYEAIKYPATVWGGTPYISSVHAGAVTLRAEIENLASACPSTNILLAGYSQGAQVIGDVLDGESQPQLSATAKAHVRSVVLFGDPSFYPGTAWDAPGDGTNGGIFARNIGAFNSWTDRVVYTPSGTYLTSRIRSYCWAGDQYCQNAGPSGAGIHASYGATATMSAAWGFLKEPLYDYN